MKLTQDHLQQIPVFGIAGNFAEHLSQAGEDADFVSIKTADPAAPKGIFPIYLPQHPSFLGVYPLSHQVIQADFSHPIHLQMEPEMCVLFNVDYDTQGQVTSLTPQALSAFNDCSIRKPNAQKISEKKNWGLECSGIANTWQPLENFKPGDLLDYLHIASFINRGGQVQAYGIDSAVKGYQYFYERLIQWCETTLNTQTDLGPLEDLHQYLNDLQQPEQIIITLGATRYTPFGETGYLQPQDQIGIFIYDERHTSEAELQNYFANKIAAQKTNTCPQGSIELIQTIQAL